MNLLTYGLAALLVALASATIQPIRRAPAARILLGTARHIFVADFSPSRTKELTLPISVTLSGMYSGMAFAPPNTVYAADQSASNLFVFELNLQDNMIKPKRVGKTSSGVVHLQFNADKTRLVGSAYDAGTIDIWDIENDSLDLIKTIRSPGKLGPNTARQSARHPHHASFDPTGRFLVVNDLGTDSIIVIDAQDDKYNILDNIYTQPGGCGPRHGVFYPQGAKRATHYILTCEISNQVLVYSVTYQTDHLSFKQIQNIPAFGPKFPPSNKLTAAASAMVLSPDNKDLYISNQLTPMEIDTVTHFRLSHSNYSLPKLSYVGTTSTGGTGSQMMSLSWDGEYVFAGNQDAGYGLVAIKRDSNGVLRKTRVAQLSMSDFGDEGSGPLFVQQIA